MHENILLILALLFLVFLLFMLAQKIKIAYPIFLVIAGLGISFIPGLPILHLDPDIIFLIFLPPLLYEAAWYTSWNDFWKWKRPISLLAFGLVFFTSLVVAYFASSFIPGFTLAMGFLLGGIISPPDAVSATTVLKGLKVPKRTITILEGESLVNDASSLIVFRFALVAVLTGAFSMKEATEQFFIVAGMGIVVGLVGAHLMYAIHRYLPTTPAIDAALTVMTPYLLYLGAEHFHFSGVMAVVSGGLFLSFRSSDIFHTGETRINMIGIWNTLIFVMSALVFILIGLELPEIIKNLGENTIWEGVKYGIIISAIIIILRILWIYPAAYIPRWLSKSARRDASPGWKNPLVIGWAGMRGVVSLATALSMPMMMDHDTPFPHRSLIILITFVVIFITLVFQGLTLPLLLKWIKMEEIDEIVPSHEQQAHIQQELDTIGLQLLETKYQKQLQQNAILQALKSNLSNDLENQKNYLSSVEMCSNRVLNMREYNSVLLEIHGLQRKEIFAMKKQNRYSEEELRKAESKIDLDELRIFGTKYL